MIVNIKNDQNYDIYMGRENTFLGLPQSKWANPHKLVREGQRLDCLEKFYNYAVKQEKLISELYELDDKILGCYCQPKFCHSSIWLYLRSKQKQGLDWKPTFCEEMKTLIYGYITS